MRWIVLSFVVFMMAFPLHAGSPNASIVDTKQPFESYISKLKSAISMNKMGLVSQACATCGAKKIGVTIPGNRVLMIFNPHFAVRMLKASLPAGVEAPLRIYVTENDAGNARVSYKKPSDVFAPYNVKALDEMAKELDMIFKKIVQDSL